ncbi:MAG TPA: ribonuclease HII [Acidimicrobiales bacterium]
MSVPALDLLAFERPLLSRGEVVVGLDEVGRGALAGPMTVGAVVITEDARPPVGLTDSKALTPKRREALVEPLERWAGDWSLGSVSAIEIDRWGLRLALAVAATRALDGLRLVPTFALIDGSFNLLNAPLRFSDDHLDPPTLHYADLAHTTIIKGDSRSGTIAAASVLAKVQRDRTMKHLALEFPEYGWDANKGYGAPRHLAALVNEGPCGQHRMTWRLTS